MGNECKVCRLMGDQGAHCGRCACCEGQELKVRPTNAPPIGYKRAKRDAARDKAREIYGY